MGWCQKELVFGAAEQDEGLLLYKSPFRLDTRRHKPSVNLKRFCSPKELCLLMGHYKIGVLHVTDQSDINQWRTIFYRNSRAMNSLVKPTLVWTCKRLKRWTLKFCEFFHGINRYGKTDIRIFYTFCSNRMKKYTFRQYHYYIGAASWCHMDTDIVSIQNMLYVFQKITTNLGDFLFTVISHSWNRKKDRIT